MQNEQILEIRQSHIPERLHTSKKEERYRGKEVTRSALSRCVDAR